MARIEVDDLPGTVERVAADIEAALADSPPRPASIPTITGWQHRVPYGLIGNITPWNFPIILSFVDTLPALAAGNAVLVKPSEVTPRWVEPARKIISEVPGSRRCPRIATGYRTGRRSRDRPFRCRYFHRQRRDRTYRLRGRSRLFHPAFLELGGKDPAIVLDSADVGFAAQTVVTCSVGSTGQACQSLERVYVARPLLDEFVAGAVETAENVTLNHPDIDAGLLGPFIFEKQPHIVMEHLRDAVDKGAVIHCGGEIIDHGGMWMRPTVLTNVSHDMKVRRRKPSDP